MYKERLVSLPNFGKMYPNNLYSGISSSAAIPATKEIRLAAFNAGAQVANVHVGAPSYTGVQKFYSTTNKRPLFNECDNRLLEAVSLPYAAWTGNVDWKYMCVPNRWSSRNFWRTASPIGYSLLPLQGAEWDSARRRAWWSMQPRFQGEVSMLNFLFELKDFKDILKFLAKSDFRTVTKKSLSLRNYLRKSKPGNIDPSLPAAKLHLLNEFAIKPLMSDVAAIMAQLITTVRDAQTKFQTAGTDRQKSHYSESEVFEEQLVYGTKNYWYHASGLRSTERFSATLEYKYLYSMRTQHDAFLKYWGLDGTFETFWNGIPGSFLLDYIITIGKSIHAMEIDRNVQLFDTQYCESLLKESTGGNYLTYRPLSGCHAAYVVDGMDYLDPSEPVFYTGIRSTHYSRVITDPNKGTALPRFKAPSWAQSKNVLALARCFIS